MPGLFEHHHPYHHPRRRSTPHTYAPLTRRLQSSYLAEWIEYHRLVGVQHFFMFTNDCEPEEAAASRRILEPYVPCSAVLTFSLCMLAVHAKTSRWCVRAGTAYRFVVRLRTKRSLPPQYPTHCVNAGTLHRAWWS